MNMKSRWIIAGAAALSLSLLTLPLLRGRTGGEKIPAGSKSAASGRASCDAEGRANFDFVLKDQHNVPVKMADYKGKVVLLNFWATWCGPCKVEIPAFVELYDQYKDKGLVIVGVSVDDSPEQLQAFMKEYHMNYPVLQMTPDVETAFGPFYGYPTSFFIGRDGTICVKHLGPATKEQFETQIKALLSDKTVL
jgi:cytochrome c biogenesis protein CcmG/thiol:disulfide interchange protein DsbE